MDSDTSLNTVQNVQIRRKERAARRANRRKGQGQQGRAKQLMKIDERKAVPWPPLQLNKGTRIEPKPRKRSLGFLRSVKQVLGDTRDHIQSKLNGGSRRSSSTKWRNQPAVIQSASSNDSKRKEEQDDPLLRPEKPVSSQQLSQEEEELVSKMSELFLSNTSQKQTSSEESTLGDEEEDLRLEAYLCSLKMELIEATVNAETILALVNASSKGLNVKEDLAPLLQILKLIIEIVNEMDKNAHI